MEKTRMERYKELRESMKEEVPIKREKIEAVDDEEDDFLSFLPKDEQEEEKEEDTLKNPLSYETLDEASEEVQDALNIAKMNVGKTSYNTRLDILNKIKNEENKEVEENLDEGHVVGENNKKVSLLEKLASMSPEEDVEELEKYQQESKQEEIKEESEDEEKVELLSELIEKEKEYEEEEEEPKKGSKLITVLNIILGILIIALVFVIITFIKQVFFS